jgi:hypothetical protein
MGDEKHENKQRQNIFKIEIESDKCRRSSGTQKSKNLTEDFLGCVECSTIEVTHKNRVSKLFGRVKLSSEMFMRLKVITTCLLKPTFYPNNRTLEK